MGKYHFKTFSIEKWFINQFSEDQKNQCLIPTLTINKKNIVISPVFASTFVSSALCLLEKILHCKAAVFLDEDKDQDLL